MGNDVTHTGEYASHISPRHSHIERALEDHRPLSKPKRSDYLFVFRDENAALKFWSKMEGGKLYRVAVAEVLHEGDMNITEQMAALPPDSPQIVALATKYWKGVMTSDEEVEYLVTGATVVQVLSIDDEERKRQLHRRWGQE